MNPSTALPGVYQYLQAVQDMQKRIIETQAGVFDQVIEQMLKTVRGGGRIFVFGTGHSHMMAEEAFFRAGGLAAAVPIFMNDLMLHANPDLSSRLERTPGIAPILLDQYHVQAGEMLFIYSNSGVNQLPVEMAMQAKERGLVVVGVCSREYARVAPLSALGKRLDEVADYVIDNMGVPGDAVVELEDCEWRVGPTSTITGAFIWNSLTIEVVRRMNAAGEAPPVYASFNMRGATDFTRAMMQTWGRQNPHLKGWIDDGI